MIILGIETSCDETAAAVVDSQSRKVLSNVVHSQLEHADYGGVVPELAARAHAERLPSLVKQALNDAKISAQELDGVAATTGPGLLGGLLVGSTFAKSFALANNLPFIPTNHLAGHALSPQLAKGEELYPPYLLLLVSGGHCQFVMVNEANSYTEVGGTIDDAVGECFDKTAKLLGLGMPGGPKIEQLAKTGDARAFDLPFPLNDKGCDFSFSGLKTAVRNIVHADAWDNDQAADLAASFQMKIAEILAKKTANALAKTGANTFVIAGGVAANQTIRAKLTTLCAEHNIHFVAPPLPLCTDNAAMIAYAAGCQTQSQVKSDLTAKPTPRWPLASISA